MSLSEQVRELKLQIDTLRSTRELYAVVLPSRAYAGLRWVGSRRVDAVIVVYRALS